MGTLAFLGPILVSVGLAWRQGINDEKAEGVRYAAEVVRRGEETTRQFDRTIRILNQDHLPPCSPQEIDLMRQIDIGSRYLQMVGRISGDALECSSLGTLSPIQVGAPTLMTDRGVRERLGVRFGPDQNDNLDLIERDGIAVLVDSSLLIDQKTEGDDVGLAMMVPSSPDHAKLAQKTERFRTNWLQPLGRGQSASFLDGGFVVSQVRSKTFDIAGVSVIPTRYAYRHVQQFAKIFVPIGALCGLGFMWAVVYISRSRTSLPGLVRAAARSGGFFVEYQPVVELATRRIVGAEALVRLRRGDTVISPSHFVALAEESGDAALITENVVDLVSRDLPKLLELSPDFRIAINFTATDLNSPATSERLQELLRRSGASPHNVILEATEHGFVNGPGSRQLISNLRRQGFQIAIDDFGTGYSSLSCLQQLDLDLLKIDKIFIETIGTDGATSEVVLHIIEMARSLKLRLVAEGVETEAQAHLLAQRGVQYGQGWLFGRPMALEALRELLLEDVCRTQLEPVGLDGVYLETPLSL